MVNIFFPIETINRELDWRILLAAKVLEPGQRIYICDYKYLNRIIEMFRGGLFVGKHILPRMRPAEKWDRYKKAKQCDINVIYLHEEGGIFPGNNKDWEKRLYIQYDPTGFDSNDRLCVWGEWQKSVHDQQSLDVPVITTGHPRLDFCKPEYQDYYKKESDQLRKEYGDFILVNGNYGWSNNGMGISFVFSKKRGYDPLDTDKRQQYIDFYAKSTKSMVDMISLVHRLATVFPEKNIVFRSHPSESDSLYQAIFNGLPNVKVLHEGAIGPWILAADTLIHDGCTTAIEASFSNTTIINYKRSEDTSKDIRLPNIIGSKATTSEHVIELIKKREPQQISKSALDELGSMMANYHMDSFESLSGVIKEYIQTVTFKNTRAPGPLKLKIEYTKHVLRKLSKKRNDQSDKYQNKKFPGFDMTYVRDKIHVASKMTGTSIGLVYSDPLLFVLEATTKASHD